MIDDQLAQLDELHRRGALDDEELVAARAQVSGQGPPDAPSEDAAQPADRPQAGPPSPPPGGGPQESGTAAPQPVPADGRRTLPLGVTLAVVLFLGIVALAVLFDRAARDGTLAGVGGGELAALSQGGPYDAPRSFDLELYSECLVSISVLGRDGFDPVASIERDGELVAYDDDSLGTDPYLELTNPPAGRYTLVVEGFDDSGGSFDLDAYQECFE